MNGHRIIVGCVMLMLSVNVALSLSDGNWDAAVGWITAIWFAAFAYENERKLQ